MSRAALISPAGTWPKARAIDAVTLAYEDRRRRRMLLVTDRGMEILLDLPLATVLNDGDGLLLDDGEWIAVRTAPEDLLEITAPVPGHLVRLAWHIGHRLCPAELHADRILIRYDPVVADLLRGLGAELRRVRAPFTPEGSVDAAELDPHIHPPRRDTHWRDS